MDFYSWIALLTMIVTLFAIWKVRKRPEYKYTLLDTAGIVLNTVLIVMVYPPLCTAAALLGIGSFAAETLSLVLEQTAVAMGRLMPAVCVAGIGASVLLRRKEKPVHSFWIQFAGFVWFALLPIPAKLSGSY